MARIPKDMYIRFDWAMKRLLRNKANFVVLEGFITSLLGEKIEIVELLESESNQLSHDDKYNRVDIKAKDSRGDLIIIEIQNTREIHYLKRILYGAAKAITEHIDMGDDYDKIKKIYSISILYFDFGDGSDYVYRGQNTFKGIHTGLPLKLTQRERNGVLTIAPENIFPEYFLLCVNGFDKVAVSPLDEWMSYLKTGLIKEDAAAPGLPEAREQLNLYSMSERERDAYVTYMMDRKEFDVSLADDRRKAREEGLAEGRAEGLKQGRMEIIAKMRAAGMSDDQIAVIVGDE